MVPNAEKMLAIIIINGEKWLMGKDWRPQSILILNFILEFLLIINNNHLLTTYHVLYIR